MKIVAFPFFACLLLISCNSSDHNNANTADSLHTGHDQNNDTTHDLSGCYLRVVKRDTMALTLEERNNVITGRLSFDNYEKDGSSGSVIGTVDKDILKLIYDFQSEGMHSVMEIYFRITGKGLIRGIGEVATRSDTAYYANPEKITYPGNSELLKIACEELDQKYK